jgi:hypothetical protein
MAEETARFHLDANHRIAHNGADAHAVASGNFLADYFVNARFNYYLVKVVIGVEHAAASHNKVEAPRKLFIRNAFKRGRLPDFRQNVFGPEAVRNSQGD